MYYMKKYFLIKVLLVLLSCSIFLSSCSMNLEHNYSDEEIKEKMDNSLMKWMENTISYDDVVKEIQIYENDESTKTKELVKEYLTLVKVENDGYQLLEEAEKDFYEENYVNALIKLDQIDTTFSQKDIVDTLYKNCKDIILLLVSNPNTISEYEDALSTLSNCLSKVNDEEINSRYKSLKLEYDNFRTTKSIVDKAQKQYAEKKYKKSFETLKKGIKKYPKNKTLSECLNGFYNLYVLDVAKEVEELCEIKEYKKAKEIIEKASNNYECEEFEIMLETVKEKENFAYKLVKDIVRSFDSLSNKWDSEELTVKKVAENTGNYVVKSGKKLILGDYSEDNVTILSTGASVISSLANLDLLFDLRDLSYDITHWGEEEYFMFYLAADVVALIPVIGVIKYFNFFDKTSQNVKDVSKVVDDVIDQSKNIDKATDAIEEIVSASKNLDSIEEVVDSATDNIKNSENVVDKIKDIVTGHTRYYETINSSLKNKKHPMTGVLFKEKKVKYTYVDDLVAVFPKFDSLFDYKLTEDLWKQTDAIQFKKCNEELYNNILKNKKLKKQFSEEELLQLSKGETPTRFTWHHSEEEGLMQLVDAETHKHTGHTGGRNLWGGGTVCRKTDCTLEE